MRIILLVGRFLVTYHSCSSLHHFGTPSTHVASVVSRLMTLFPVQLRSGSSRITQHVHFTETMFTGLGFYGMPTFLLFFNPSMQTNFHIGIPSTLLNAKTATALP